MSIADDSFALTAHSDDHNNDDDDDDAASQQLLSETLKKINCLPYSLDLNMVIDNGNTNRGEKNVAKYFKLST